MAKNDRWSITPWQLTSIIFGATVGVGILTLPKEVDRIAGSAGWIATFFGGLITLTAAWVMSWLVRKHPQKTYIEFFPELLGQLPGKVVVFIMIVYQISVVSLFARAFGEVVMTTILLNTPLEVIVLSMVLLAGYLARQNLRVVARINEIFLLVVLFFILGISLLTLQFVSTLRLLPLLGQGPLAIARGALEAAAAFLGFEMVLFAGSFVNQPDWIGKASTIAILGITILYSLGVLVATGVFGPQEVEKFLWPTFEVVKNTEVPGLVLERLDVLFVSVWLVAVFTTIGTYYYFGVQGLARLLGFKEHKILVLPLLPLIYRLGMEPGDLGAVFRALRWSGMGGVVLFVLFPFLVAGVTLIKERGDQSQAQKRRGGP